MISLGVEQVQKSRTAIFRDGDFFFFLNTELVQQKVAFESHSFDEVALMCTSEVNFNSYFFLFLSCCIVASIKRG